MGRHGSPGVGNGEYRGALGRAGEAIRAYIQAHGHRLAQTLVRLDGQYGNGAIVVDLADLPYVMRGKDYHLLALPEVQARLTRPPDFRTTHPETGTTRALYDGPTTAITATGETCRMIVATHPAATTPAPVGTTREKIVYELFFTALPQAAFTAADVVALYLHRGAFETVRASEDQQQDPDRWWSHTVWGQEGWQILSQWIWNLRAVCWGISFRLTRCASPSVPKHKRLSLRSLLPLSHAFLNMALRRLVPTSRMGCLPGSEFPLQADGTLRCPAGHPLYLQERRPEGAGTLRLVSAARIGHCRPCRLREACQG